MTDSDSFQHAMARDFGVIADLVRIHARQRPDSPALQDGKSALTYAELDAIMDRVAAALQRDGLRAGDAVALCATPSAPYAAVFLGALRAGAAVAPLAPGSTPASLVRMMEDAEARWLFTDAAAAEGVGAARLGGIPRIALDGSAAGRAFDDWLAPVGSRPAPVELQPASPFNII